MLFDKVIYEKLIRYGMLMNPACGDEGTICFQVKVDWFLGKFLWEHRN